MQGSIRLALLVSLVLLAPRPASACGGCFHPLEGSPTVVTRHQMAVSMSPEQTTLWDQIEYAGNPEDFVWVLPVRDGAPVELAENAFFEALQQSTTIRMQVQPARTFCPDPCGGIFLGSAGAPRAEDEGGVTVHHEASIGPYETATVGSEDPEAIIRWLQDRGYAVPDRTLPTIRHYTDQGMDFAVLRLSSSAGASQMQPVRVTTPGLSVTFPLRMIAAGAANVIGLELFVIAEGRYEAANMPNVEVDRGAITYDWNTESFDYEAHYAAAIAPHEGNAWVTEVATTDTFRIGSYVSFDDDGVAHYAEPDWRVATRGLSGGAYLTRLTADLPSRFLTDDLVLQASDGGDLPAVFDVQNEIDRPEEPLCTETCADAYGSGSAGRLGWRDGGRGDGLQCRVDRGVGVGARAGLGFGALALAGLLLFARRRRD